MKIWVDDIRQAPEGYIWCKSTLKTELAIIAFEKKNEQSDGDITIEELNLDHDAGDFVNEGGDYINILKWLEATGRGYPIHIHSMNVVGVENMRRIIQKNGWKEV